MSKTDSKTKKRPSVPAAQETHSVGKFEKLTRGRTLSKKQRRGIDIAIAVVLALVLLPWILSPLLNEAAMNKLEKSLKDKQPPEGTKVVETYMDCGDLIQGNGMQYLAALLVKSDKTAEELKTYYGATVHAQENRILEIEIGDSYIALSRPYLFKTLENVQDHSGYYLVYLYDAGHATIYDPRMFG